MSSVGTCERRPWRPPRVWETTHPIWELTSSPSWGEGSEQPRRKEPPRGHVQTSFY